MDDYYKILEINKNASEEEVKKAYRRLAHQHHPDRPGGNAEKFKKINEAYQILSNKEKRTQYDRFGKTFSAEGGSPFGWEFGFDPGNFEDLGGIGEIFDAFFEGMGVKRRKKTYNRGSDVEVIQEITLEDAFNGLAKKVSLPFLVKCEVCAGQGFDEAAGVKPCGACDGQGEIRESRNTFFGNFSQVKNCAKCWGTGKIPEKICRHCSGGGRIKGSKEVNFSIIPGISDGQIIKIAGAGEAGERGAAPGDIYVRIKVKPHPVFKRYGDDLLMEKEIGLIEVLLKKSIEIKTISGNKIKTEIRILFLFISFPGNLFHKIKIPCQS